MGEFCSHGVFIGGFVRCEECCKLTEDWDRNRPAPNPMKLTINTGQPCTCKAEAKRWCDYGVDCDNVRRVDRGSA